MDQDVINYGHLLSVFRLSCSGYYRHVHDFSGVRKLISMFKKNIFTVLLINRVLYKFTIQKFDMMIADNFDTFENQRQHFRNCYLQAKFDHTRII